MTNRQIEGRFLVFLAKAYLLLGRLDEARRAAGRSLELCRTIGFAYGVGLAERNLGRLALAAGAPRRGVCGLQALEGVRSCIPTFPAAVSDVGMPDLVARADELRRSREVDHPRSAGVTQARNSLGRVDQERDREQNAVTDRYSRDCHGRLGAKLK